MTRSRPLTFLAGAAAIPLVALTVAACGGGGGAATAATATSTSAPKTTSAPTAMVRVANSRLGKILVDSQGRTLYLFKADSGNKSECSGPCATAWPPQADGRQRRKRVAGRYQPAVQWSGAGDLQRSPAVPIRQGPQAR